MNNYVKISITGKNPKLLLKRFFINKINYFAYKEINHKKIELKLFYNDYLKLISKKSIYEIKIIKRYGLNKYVNFYKENTSFIICFIISLIMIFILSNISFEINVIHNDKKIRTLVEEELKKRNIRKLYLIPNFNKRKQIIKKIIESNKDKIEWMEIERKGSKLIVKVTERRFNKKEDILNERHIVAKKEGIITKIYAEEGVILKKENDYVSKGDIIISGDIIKDDTIKKRVVAKGKVYAEVWYKVNVEYPLYYKEIKYLSDIKTDIVVDYFNKSYFLRKNYSDYYLKKKKMVIKEKIFPYKLSIQKRRKTKVTKQKLSKEMALKKAENLAERKIKARLSKDEYIIDKKTLNFEENNSKIIVDVFFKVCEDITDFKDVDENIMEEKKK